MVTGTNNPAFVVRVYAGNGTDTYPIYFGLYPTATGEGAFRIDPYFNLNTAYVNVATGLLENVWYKAEVEFDWVNHTYRGRVNGGAWSQTRPLKLFHEYISKVDMICISRNVESYVDNFTLGPLTNSVTVSRNIQAGGGVSSYPGGEGIYCGIDGYEICQYSFSHGEELTLDAYPNDDYVFSHWEWADGASSSTDNPLVITLLDNMEITAIFDLTLKFPLTGTLGQRGTPLLSFGDNWVYEECPTGTYKKHVGIDLQATAGEAVYAAHTGTVKAIYAGQNGLWADAIVLESSDGQYTTVYWHIIKYGNLSVNDTVIKGQQIATIANLGSDTHFHFGVRVDSYDTSLSLAGALPEESCGGYLAFPGNFINPANITFE